MPDLHDRKLFTPGPHKRRALRMAQISVSARHLTWVGLQRLRPGARLRLVPPAPAKPPVQEE